MHQSTLARRRRGARARRVRLAIVAMTAGAAPLLGCFAYVPTAGAPAPAGSRVRVQLTDAGSTSLSSYLGPGVVAVTGRLVAADDSVVSVAMGETQLGDGSERYWNGEPVAVPRRYVATMQRHQFSGSRTALLSAGLGGLALAIARGLGGIGGGNTSPTHSGGGGPK